MKKTKRPIFFIVAAAILLFTYLSVFGISYYYGDNRIVRVKGVNDIRWGIDIQGGVEAIFTPDINAEDITSEEMNKAEQILKTRLTNKNITDYELYVDKGRNKLIVRFPWKSDREDFDPAEEIRELGAMAELQFCEGSDDNNTVILSGKHVSNASYGYDEKENQHVVQLKFDARGKQLFAEATQRLVNQYISIWFDGDRISAATVNEAITDGNAVISGSFTAEEATDLANNINAGSLPFSLSVDDSKLSIISPTLGESSLMVMLYAGIAAFIVIVLLMLLLYRLPGFVAMLSITAQIVIIFACTSGFFPWVDSFTLTIPGIAGIILSIGMGVDANVINAERVADEVREERKTLDGAISTGFQRGFGAILDGNVTVVIVSVILMGAFGPPSSIWAKILSPVMFMFESSIAGSIYSFGYTLLIGSIANLIIGVWVSNWMIKSLSSFRGLRKPWLYGGEKKHV